MQRFKRRLMSFVTRAFTQAFAGKANFPKALKAG